MTKESRNFWCFIGTLAAIVALSKVGGSGADLAIMTGLVGILGMLARPSQAESPGTQDVNVTNPADRPVQTEEAKP